MSIEQLMQPRYKVIADYPASPYKVGEILIFWEISQGYDESKRPITLDLQDSGWEFQRRVNEEEFKKYPHLFRPLQWWEERKPEDMPQYIRFKLDNTLFKIEQWDMPILFGFTDVERQRGCGLKTFKPEYGYEPATEAEYLTYINSK